MSIYYEAVIVHTNAMCGKTQSFFYVISDGAYISHEALKV